MIFFNQHRTLVIASVMFFALGVVTSALGPLLPELAVNARSSLSQVGAIFTMLFLGALLAELVVGPIIDRFGQRPVLLGGLVLLAAGILGVSFSGGLLIMMACALIAGVGHGAVDVGGNVMIAEAYTTRRVSALNLLNLFFGIGAVAGPAIASVALAVWGKAIPALWLSSALLALLIPFVAATATAHGVRPSSTTHAPVAIFGAPLLWAFGVLLLVYVGTEVGIGGWTTTYINRTTGMAIETAALVTSGFWLTLTAGRMIAVFIGARLAPTGVLWLSLAGALAGGALLASSTGNAALSIAAVLVVGFFFGPIFPTVLAIATASFPGGPGKAASIVVLFGSIGGMVLPWLQGVLLEGRGPFASVLFVGLCTAAMLALFGGIRMASKQSGQRLQLEERRTE